MIKTVNEVWNKWTPQSFDARQFFFYHCLQQDEAKNSEQFILGNKCDLEDSRVISVERGKIVRFTCHAVAISINNFTIF